MGLLEKYGRKKTGEKRNKQIGAKIEPSLFEDFSKHCDSLGLSVSDGIRYLIIEELTKDKPDKVQEGTSVTSIDHDETTFIKPKKVPIDNKGNTKVKPKGDKRTTKDKENPLDQWTIDKQIVCPECEIWMLRKSFHKHCRNKHNASAYDWLLLNKDKADAMVKEKQEKSEH